MSMPALSFQRISKAALSVLDPATAWFIATRLFGIVMSPLTLAIVAAFLSPIEQGYFYTIFSILSLIVFFELGLGGVVIFIVGHRGAEISWGKMKQLTGTPDILSWIGAVYRKIAAWYGVMAVAFFVVVAPIGCLLLSSKTALPPATYLVPFIFVVLLFSVNIFQDGTAAFLEGTGRIKEVKRAQFMSGAAGSLALLLALLLHSRLWSIVISEIATVTVLGVWLYSYRSALFGLLKSVSSDTSAVSWRDEILPLQWRIALTWLSGYFINMAFVPILFALRGPIEAGQMGMALKISGALYTLSIGLVSAKSAKLSAMAASDYPGFLRLLRHSALAAAGLSAAGALAVLVAMIVLKFVWPAFLDRLLPMGPMMAIMGVPVIGAIATSMQIYARTQKQDPFVWANMITAVCVTSVTLFTAYKMDASAMAYGYFAVLALISIPLHIYSLRHVKRLPRA
ncbi:hypothetical protein FHS83_000221 [Rhizomicrobium palustre]|uniref:Polysaccharide biosynthesis protein n=1 Tax=Rhizomicrobium palustre TaxID=189966 RepID=A0A846MU68_9PROT|nr:hypothetical protein [Rhizomicrobium palustre]NIK86903.1 hypothetical protein [Rhizomicrobium palustre]